MDTKIVIGNIEKVAKQRNLFALLTLLLASSTLLIALRLFTFDQRIVLVPGLQSQMSLSGTSVSSSYLEQMALIFLSQLLDISSSDISYKRELILKYTSHSDSEYSKRVNEYFGKAEEEYSKFNLATHFTVKNLQVNQQDLSVIACGILTSWYGKKGYESKPVTYKVSFEYGGGYLRLKEFNQIVKEKDKE